MKLDKLIQEIRKINDSKSYNFRMIEDKIRALQDIAIDIRSKKLLEEILEICLEEAKR